jgi:hypothetical protein
LVWSNGSFSPVGVVVLSSLMMVSFDVVMIAPSQ